MGEMNNGRRVQVVDRWWMVDDNQPGVSPIVVMVGGGGEKNEKIKKQRRYKKQKIGVPFLAFVFDSCILSRKSGEKRRKKKRRGSRVRES